MTEFTGLRTRLKPGMAEAYEQAHAELWPDVLIAHRELGIRRWLIFRHGLELFHAVECDDFERASAALAHHPLDQRWQQHMAPYVVAADDRSGAATERLRLVYAG
jgi:L-rhamnose mutarotase